MSKSALIAPRHLSRLAVIYIRQASPQQVLTNQESTRLQYALRQRAEELGWRPEDIAVIDADLGQSGASAGDRAGFQELLTKVTLGHVGLILSVDVTRLARNCSDWYPLLDLCGLKGCLIADRDGVYEPASPNGRLLLGLKGQISELELHTIRARLTAGLLNKAERGELALPLPVGLVRDERGAVVKDPNAEVQQRIALVFATFLAVRSAGKAATALDRAGLRLPRRDRFGDVAWRRPTTSAVLAMLRNPAYAGAFVYGRRQSVRRDHTARRPVQRALPIAAWRVRVPDKYPAYIDWPQYEKIQAMLDENRAEYTRDRTRGVPRAGAALLQGIAYCGESGHKLTVVYRPRAQYRCVELRRRYGGPLCQTIPADPVDARVVAAFFDALRPAELDLYDRALRDQHAAAERVARAHAQQLARLRYEAALAERQFRRVDPDNRLVAGELERRWEQALHVLAAVQEAAERVSQAAPAVILGPALREQLRDLGPRLPALWASGRLTAAHKKALLRALIRRVILARPVPATVEATVVWVSGARSALTIRPPLQRTADLANYGRLVARLRELSATGLDDAAIAQQLTAEGLRGARRTAISRDMVGKLRRDHGLHSVRAQYQHQDRVDGQWTTGGLARLLGVHRKWLYAQVARGILPVTHHPLTGHLLVADDHALLARLRAALAAERTTD